MISLNKINSHFRLSCLTGFLLSCYALYVELKKEVDENYEAYCDINEHISCTKAFSSEYGKGFGIIGSIFGKDSLLNQPNSLFGIIFYFTLMLMSFSDLLNVIKLQTVFCIVSNFMSVYFAYILYFLLKDFCLICVATYVINAINLILCVFKWNIVRRDIAFQTLLIKKSGVKKD